VKRYLIPLALLATALLPMAAQAQTPKQWRTELCKVVKYEKTKRPFPAQPKNVSFSQLASYFAKNGPEMSKRLEDILKASKLMSSVPDHAFQTKVSKWQTGIGELIFAIQNLTDAAQHHPGQFVIVSLSMIGDINKSKKLTAPLALPCQSN
jgi:hypothetical protein